MVLESSAAILSITIIHPASRALVVVFLVFTTTTGAGPCVAAVWADAFLAVVCKSSSTARLTIIFVALVAVILALEELSVAF